MWPSLFNFSFLESFGSNFSKILFCFPTSNLIPKESRIIIEEIANVTKDIGDKPLLKILLHSVRIQMMNEMKAFPHLERNMKIQISYVLLFRLLFLLIAGWPLPILGLEIFYRMNILS